MNAAFHEHFMRLALDEAERAARLGEVPAGCVILSKPASTDAAPSDVAILARCHNQTETLGNPTAHAEMLAIRQAASALGDWRLSNTILYVTKEPCAMCAGAIVLARVPLVVYAFPDPRRGGVSLFNITGHPNLNHRPEMLCGVLRGECLAHFQAFFQARRLGEG